MERDPSSSLLVWPTRLLQIVWLNFIDHLQSQSIQSQIQLRGLELGYGCLPDPLPKTAFGSRLLLQPLSCWSQTRAFVGSQIP